MQEDARSVVAQSATAGVAKLLRYTLRWHLQLMAAETRRVWQLCRNISASETIPDSEILNIKLLILESRLDWKPCGEHTLGQMSSWLHRLRASLLRTLLLAGIVQLAAPGAALLREFTGDAPSSVANDRAAGERSTHESGTDEQLQGAEQSAEIDEADGLRRRLNVRSAMPSRVLPKVFWEESIRIRVEDRRNCRPPNLQV